MEVMAAGEVTAAGGGRERDLSRTVSHCTENKLDWIVDCSFTMQLCLVIDSRYGHDVDGRTHHRYVQMKKRLLRRDRYFLRFDRMKRNQSKSFSKTLMEH